MDIYPAAAISSSQSASIPILTKGRYRLKTPILSQQQQQQRGKKHDQYIHQNSFSLIRARRRDWTFEWANTTFTCTFNLQELRLPTARESWRWTCHSHVGNTTSYKQSSKTPCRRDLPLLNSENHLLTTTIENTIVNPSKNSWVLISKPRTRALRSVFLRASLRLLVLGQYGRGEDGY